MQIWLASYTQMYTMSSPRFFMVTIPFTLVQFFLTIFPSSLLQSSLPFGISLQAIHTKRPFHWLSCLKIAWMTGSSASQLSVSVRKFSRVFTMYLGMYVRTSLHTCLSSFASEPVWQREYVTAIDDSDSRICIIVHIELKSQSLLQYGDFVSVKLWYASEKKRIDIE